MEESIKTPNDKELLHEFYLACVYLDKAVPVYGMTNTERIRAAADEIVRLRGIIDADRKHIMDLNAEIMRLKDQSV